MYSEKLENLIDLAISDSELTEKEKQVLFKKAQEEGIDLDEFEMVLDAKLSNKAKAQGPAPAEGSAPKSNKYGDVRKCPACGAMVPSLAGVCPECGFEFTGLEANLSSQKLAEQLLEVNDLQKKKELIVTFPIPNTKADLFEFLTSMQPRMRDVNDPLAASYFKKYEECINKAKVTFANDPNLRPFVESFEEEKKALKRKQAFHTFFAWFGKHKGLTAFIIIMMIGVVGATIDGIKESRAEKNGAEHKARIERLIRNGEKDSVMIALKEAPKFDNVNDLVKELVDENYLDEAIYLCENKSDSISVYRKDEACKALYRALINAERMEEAWRYKELLSPDENNIANVDEVKKYMCDVVEHYCKQGKKDEARQFVKEHLAWFINNIDNNVELSDGEVSDYSSKAVNQQMEKLINNY